MSVTVSFKPIEGHTLNRAMDVLDNELQELIESLGDRLVLTGDASGAFGSGEPAIVELQMTFPTLTKEMAQDMRPLFRFVADILKKYADQPITVTLLISDGEHAEAYQFHD